jgi:hypothetical protein
MLTKIILYFAVPDMIDELSQFYSDSSLIGKVRNSFGGVISEE